MPSDDADRDQPVPQGPAPANAPPESPIVSIRFQHAHQANMGSDHLLGDHIDWQAHPRLEKEMREICDEIAQISKRLEKLKTPRAAKGTLRAQTDLGTIARLQEQRKKLFMQATQLTTVLDPVVRGTVLDKVKSDATRDLENTFNTVWKDYQRSQKSSCTKYLWTTLSGCIAYSIPFGSGTMAARATGLPFLQPIIAGPLHTLFEPFWTSLRVTTWTNPSQEQVLQRQRVHAHAAGDRVRACAGIKPKAKFLYVNPETGEKSVLTARQFLDTADGVKLWSDKTITDDLPFFVFTFDYVVKNLLVEIYGLSFYDHKQPDGWRNDMGLQFAAGMLSGSLAMLFSQKLRQYMASRTGGREVVNKSLHVWRREARFLESYKADIELALEQQTRPRAERELLQEKCREIETQLATARAKSWMHTALMYDFRTMFQGKRKAVGTTPDISGKRLDTVCSILGRTTSLIPGMVVTYLCQPLQKLDTCRAPDHVCQINPLDPPANYIDPVSAILRHVAPPLALVSWPGFNSRLEWQGAYRTMAGLMKGAHDAMRACCHGVDDEAEDGEQIGDAQDSPGSADANIDGHDHVTDVASALRHAHTLHAPPSARGPDTGSPAAPANRRLQFNSSEAEV